MKFELILAYILAVPCGLLLSIDTPSVTDRVALVIIAYAMGILAHKGWKGV